MNRNISGSQFDDVAKQYGRSEPFAPGSEQTWDYFDMSDLGFKSLPEDAPRTPEEPAPSPWNEPDEYRSYHESRYISTLMPLDDIHPAQSQVSQKGTRMYYDRLSQEQETGEATWEGESLDENTAEATREYPPQVDYLEGRHVLGDGHHRVAAAKLHGLGHMRVSLDRRSPYNPWGRR